MWSQSKNDHVFCPLRIVTVYNYISATTLASISDFNRVVTAWPTGNVNGLWNTCASNNITSSCLKTYWSVDLYCVFVRSFVSYSFRRYDGVTLLRKTVNRSILWSFRRVDKMYLVKSERRNNTLKRTVLISNATKLNCKRVCVQRLKFGWRKKKLSAEAGGGEPNFVSRTLRPKTRDISSSKTATASVGLWLVFDYKTFM